MAREDADVLNLGRHDVFDALLEYPDFGMAVVQDLALRHHKLTERVIQLEQQLSSPVARLDETAEREGIEHSAPAGKLPKRRNSWRLAARLRAKPRLWRISQGQSLGGLPASPRRFHHLIIKIAPPTAAAQPGFGAAGGGDGAGLTGTTSPESGR